MRLIQRVRCSEAPAGTQGTHASAIRTRRANLIGTPLKRTLRPEAPPQRAFEHLHRDTVKWAAGRWLCFLEERQAISWIRDRLFAGTRVRLSSRAMLGAQIGQIWRGGFVQD